MSKKNNVIPFPQRMSNEEVELLALEVEIDKVAERVKILTIEIRKVSN